jgi:hypothetical protein
MRVDKAGDAANHVEEPHRSLDPALSRRDIEGPWGSRATKRVSAAPRAWDAT